MAESSLVQFPLAFITCFFNSLSMTLLDFSIYPLLYRCPSEVDLCLIPELSSNFSTPLSMNCVPFSNIKMLGMPNRHTILFQMNFRTLAAKIVVMGLTSIHFVKWSMPTRRYFTCPFDSGKGPSMSTPQMAKCHGVAVQLFNR